MGGTWVTKTAGKTPPVGDMGGIANHQSTILVQSKNAAGSDIYCYLQLPFENVDKVRQQLASGEGFVPSHFGTVLAAGLGEPTEEIQEEIGVAQFMVKFEPKRLPNLPQNG